MTRPRWAQRVLNWRCSFAQRQCQAILEQWGVQQVPADPSVTNIGLLVFHARPDLRQAFPLGLTPQQRVEYAAWLFQHGRAELGITDAELVAYFQAAAQDGTHGIVDTWRLTPEWQHDFPNALSPSCWQQFLQAIGTRYGIRARWLKQAQLKTVESLPSPGVNLLAHFRYPSGLQEEAQQYIAALQSVGWSVSVRDAPLGFSRTQGQYPYLGTEQFPLTLIKLGACESVDDSLRITGWHAQAGVYRIACWSWELECFDRRLAGSNELVNEIWAPSKFAAKALQSAFPDKPVWPMLPAVSLPEFKPKPRSYFNLPEGFLFLFAFDMNSVMERKNPLGTIAAFRKAFPTVQASNGVHLAIKVKRGEQWPEQLRQLIAAAGSNVFILETDLDRSDYLALVNSCDAYVSLHRAEGFGYTIAEAMLLGKPTIATGYSANVEFTTPAGGLLVDYRLVPIGPGCDPYPAHAAWADPYIDQAAEWMRLLVQQPGTARRIGEAARTHAQQLLSPAAAGVRMVQRLSTIRASQLAA